MNKVKAPDLSVVQPGMRVRRMLAGTVPMDLTVTDVTDEKIVCGWWEFDRELGFEIDEDLGWGRKENGEIYTGSYISEVLDEEPAEETV